MDETWAQQEMAGAQIKDRRRIRSLTRNCARLADQPGISFSAACGSAGRQAAHRLFEHPDTTVEKLLAGHVAQTAERCREHDLVLVAQDTTTFVYSTHPATEGMGPINDAAKGRGLFAHTAWALTPEGLPLGTLHVQMWARDPAEAGQRHARRTRGPAEKESHKWRTGLVGTEAALAPEQAVLIIQDREGDVFDFLATPRRPNTHLLIRASQPRAVTVAAADGTDVPVRSTLFEAVAAAPSVGTLTVRIARRPNQPEREAVFAVRARPVTIQPPRRKGVPPVAQAVWVIQATEIAPPPGEEILEWVLITTMPVATGEEACQMVRYYARRWGIERFHYTLKSGCQVERLQMDDANSVMHALAIYYVVAWRLQYLTQLARVEPETPAPAVLTEEEVTVLSQAEGQPIVTVQEAVRAIARLGGYTPYRRAPEPGVKVLWQGLRRLDGLVEGWRLAWQVIRHSSAEL